ncbi:uncharacterized protein [Gossypium hirsutum]|uniref:DNA/RNA polymerases superfamily protein n=1 Tax=Gossypium hirsutum TaxID=3635 RepID=A0A1U8L7J7_GOSHI|nr:uncharacterized protein LOC107923439 [Gossypium hirsutum]
MDKSLSLRFRQIESGTTADFGLNSDGMLCIRGRICVSNYFDLRQSILREAHSSHYAMYLDGNKMYRDLRELYWWSGLKYEVTDFLVRCLTCPELFSETKFKVRLIRDRLKVASDRQKSYADLKRRDIECSVGDFMFLNISPWKKILRFGHKGKLSPGFIGPYQIVKHVELVTYQLELPLKLDRIHDVFHVSMLRRYGSDPSHIVSVEDIEVRLDLTFEEQPVQVLERDVKVLRRNPIPLVKVLWRNHSIEEAT